MCYIYSVQKLPSWLIKKTPKQQNINKIREILGDSSIHTVCESAHCPNIGECYSKGELTFMIMGNICTRNCKFCAVSHGTPGPIDKDEPKKIAQAVKKLGLKYVVITSVTRDDLEDGGAHHFRDTIQALQRSLPDIEIEVLIPDFTGNENALKTVIKANPTVLNHNVETIERLYSTIRPQANYKRSLEILKKAKEINSRNPRTRLPDGQVNFAASRSKTLYTKSGFMVGLGESKKEVELLLADLANTNVNIVTIGQYLSPSKDNAAVMEYIKPEIFAEYEKIGKNLGIPQIIAGPFVRSSYQACKKLKDYKNYQSMSLPA